MSDVYVVEFSASFYVLADSQSEAVEIATRMSESAVDELPARALCRVDAYRTPNQEDRIKVRAENYQEVTR